MSLLGVEYGCKYTLVGPDGTRVVFNDSTDPDFVGVLGPESSGLDSADVREDATDATEEDGGHHGDFYEGRRPVIFQGTIIASSAADRNEKVAKLKRATRALREDAKLTWQPAGGPEVELLLRRQQPLRITKGYVKDFQAAMVAADIFPVGTTINEKTGGGASSETKAPTVVKDNTSIGSRVWGSPENAKASDNIRATMEFTSGGQQTHYLFASAFGFKPISNIIGIKAEVELRANTNLVKDNSVKIFVAEVAAGENKSAAAGWGFSDEIHTFGGAGDLWGTAPSTAQAEAAGFGVGISAINELGSGTAAEVDQIKLTLFYGPAELLCTNNGDAPAHPTIKIYGPGSTFKIENKTTGEYILLEGVELKEGEYFTINFKNHTILKNGVTYAYNALIFASSNWWALEPGENTVAVTGGKAIIEWRDTYL